ncbi:MAG: cell division protein FtsZ [Hyphomicrobiales bacterium]
MDEMIKFDAPKDPSSIIKVLGVGGGGSNAVNHMYSQGIKGVDFIICNTDAQALEKSPVPIKIQLGSGGLGAGSKPDVGKQSAQESLEEVRAFLEKDTKMLFVTAGMGGGTGTGAAPVIAELARELDILTVGIVTIPFQFEGKRRRLQADDGIIYLKKHVDTLLVISNDKLREAYGNLRLTEAFAKADDVLTVAARGIAEIITVSGIINVDFEDVRTVMKDSGQAIMGSAVASGEDRALKAIECAMASPLLDDNNIAGAENILLYIASSNDTEISMDEVSEITEYIQNESGNTADVIWGNGIDDTLGDAISVTLIATGFEGNQTEKDAQEKKVNDLYQSPTPNVTPAPEIVPENTPNTAEVYSPPVPQVEEQPVQPVSNSVAQVEERKKVYHLNEIRNDESDVSYNAPEEPVLFNMERDDELFGSAYNKESSKSIDLEVGNNDDSSEDITKKRLKDISLKLGRNIDPEDLENLEKQPAYLRRNVEINKSIPSKDQKISRYTMSSDKDKNPEIRSNNPYLHDNVD